MFEFEFEFFLLRLFLSFFAWKLSKKFFKASSLSFLLFSLAFLFDFLLFKVSSFSFFTPLLLFILLFSFSLLFIFLFLFFFLLLLSSSLSLSFSFFFLSRVLFFPVNCSSFFSSWVFPIKSFSISSFCAMGSDSISILLLFTLSLSILINSLLFFCPLSISSLHSILNKFSFTSLYSLNLFSFSAKFRFVIKSCI